ncbi:hypothetical protein [Paraburkholderia phenazinium]|uniref:Uncharacterized protein n=1 Tax=Paraburkholderia phenazinium TaxID=60549 RepID=A0A1G8A185_9BURK|nr:hypothetical protein [Paraburkholderia phenazinium]SDH14611.1 hypothetical protein SAMN05216466_107263 [Paraburkholderia phenazinium]
MNALALRIALSFSLTLACGATHAQALATYGDAPAAEAEGAAAAANRAGNGGGPLNAGTGDSLLLGGPAAYGDVYSAQTADNRQDQNVPAAAANPQGRGVTPVEHMLTNPGTPQPGGPAIGAAANAGKPGVGARGTGTAALTQTPVNAAQQLYGNGTASGAARHDIYKMPW